MTMTVSDECALTTQTLKTLAEHYDCVVILHYWRRKSLSVALFYVGTVSLSAIKQIHWVTASCLHVTAAQWANTQTRLLVERAADRQHWHLTAALPRDDDAASSLNLVLHSGLTLNWCLPLSQWWLLFWGGVFFFCCCFFFNCISEVQYYPLVISQ